MLCNSAQLYSGAPTSVSALSHPLIGTGTVIVLAGQSSSLDGLQKLPSFVFIEFLSVTTLLAWGCIG